MLWQQTKREDNKRQALIVPENQGTRGKAFGGLRIWTHIDCVGTQACSSLRTRSNLAEWADILIRAKLEVGPKVIWQSG